MRCSIMGWKGEFLVPTTELRFVFQPGFHLASAVGSCGSRAEGMSSWPYSVLGPTSLIVCRQGEWCCVCGKRDFTFTFAASGKARTWNEKRLETNVNGTAVPAGRKANLVIYKVRRTTFMWQQHSPVLLVRVAETTRAWHNSTERQLILIRYPSH
jgi:hypothetical protein